ncbi:MAG: MATE family efflux transporter [Clostridia bacterium]|nr:MATE family efflux transporter [Clostridia bacterium]
MKFGTNLAEGSVFKKYFTFIVPIILSGWLQQLYNTADTMVVGTFVGDAALAAVGSTSSLTNLILHLFLGLAIGTNVVCARYYGANNWEGLNRAIHTSITLAVISGVFLAMVGLFCSRPFLKIMETPDDVIDLATLYMQVFFMGSPASMVYNFGSAVLRAAGDTKRPLYILLGAGLVNVALNLFCVLVLKLGVLGVAIGTVASQLISAIVVVRILTHTDTEFKLQFSKLRIYRRELGKIAATGIPSGLNGVMFSTSNVIIQSAINSFGKLAMAGSVAATNVENFGFLVLSAVEQGAVSFVGQNMGAKKPDRITSVTKVAMIIGIASSLLFLFVMREAGPIMLGLFADDTSREAVVRMGMIKLAFVACSYTLYVPSQVLNGVLKGMGRATVPTVINSVCICGLRLLWMFVAYPFNPTLEMVYTSYSISWGCSSIAMIIAYLIVKRKIFRREF